MLVHHCLIYDDCSFSTIGSKHYPMYRDVLIIAKVYLKLRFFRPAAAYYGAIEVSSAVRIIAGTVGLLSAIFEFWLSPLLVERRFNASARRSDVVLLTLLLHGEAQQPSSFDAVGKEGVCDWMDSTVQLVCEAAWTNFPPLISLSAGSWEMCRRSGADTMTSLRSDDARSSHRLDARSFLGDERC